MVYDVTTDATIQVVDLIEATYDLVSTPLWPGVVIDGNSYFGMMLVGTPSGYGTAWLIINQVYIAGPRIIDKIHLFADEDTTDETTGEVVRKICLAFHLSDIPLDDYEGMPTRAMKTIPLGVMS